jgi:hypothetical protein
MGLGFKKAKADVKYGQCGYVRYDLRSFFSKPQKEEKVETKFGSETSIST